MLLSLLLVSSHIQAQAQTFDPNYKIATAFGELGAGARVVDNYDIPASVTNTTSPELLNYAYNQGLAMGRQTGPAGIEDSAPGAVCPLGVDLDGAFCRAWVIGYEDGFAQTCKPTEGYTCPRKDVCISHTTLS